MKKEILRASEGKTFRRKTDGFIMGRSMILGKSADGTDDTIDNYEEVEETEENKQKQMIPNMFVRREANLPNLQRKELWRRSAQPYNANAFRKKHNTGQE
jgi:hypothetical protein